MGHPVKTDSMIKRMLQNLCCSYGWSYGVFWRFDQRNSMLLTLEDACYEEQMGVEIDRMLQQVHMLGEGVIGQAAFTGRHRWISSDDHGMDWNSYSTYRDETEFHHQFLAGIKTIAVIHVESQGVLQFGSTNKIPESLEFSDQAQRSFYHVENIDSSVDFTESFPSTSGFTNRSGDDPHISHLLHSENQFRMTAATQAQVIQSSVPSISAWSTEGLTPASFEERPSSSMQFQDSLDAYSAREDPIFSCGMAVQDLEGDSVNTSLQSLAPIDAEKINAYNQSFSPLICATEVGFPEESASLCTFQEDFIPVDCSAAVPKASPFDNVLQWLALSPDERTNKRAAMTNDDLSKGLGVASVFAGLEGGGIFNDVQAKNKASTSVIDEGEKTLNRFGSSRLDIGSNLAGECWGRIGIPADSGDSAITPGLPKCISEFDVGSTVSPRKGLFSGLGLKQLLGDIVGNANMVTNSNSEGQLSAANKRRRIGNSLLNINEVELDKLTSVRSQKEGAPRSKAGLWIDDNYSNNAGSSITSQTTRHENHKKTIKKRAKPGESTRPRPKDRQLIQDRLKELKEIIPNSGKLSIDALLDRTIKHLLFLQSVTKHADRLKRDDEPKLIGQENGVVLRENSVNNGVKGGATWAYEVGGQTLVCPIIVEDLDPPGQILIEMLCEERGLFLEIADIIRGFSLTILKGVMEVRDDKLWGRFTVEANENITRMDIFMSLVNLLQQTSPNGGKSLTNEPSSVVDGGMDLFNDYHQPLVSLPH